MTINAFPLSDDMALRLIRQAAADSRNYTLPKPPEGGEWFRIVNRRQVELCLRDGALAGKPRVDASGNVHATLERFSAGVLIRVSVAVWKNDETSDWRIAITQVENGP